MYTKERKNHNHLWNERTEREIDACKERKKRKELNRKKINIQKRGGGRENIALFSLPKQINKKLVDILFYRSVFSHRYRQYPCN
jgi:hypothetical protein